jgi:hypothetical protein
MEITKLNKIKEGDIKNKHVVRLNDTINTDRTGQTICSTSLKPEFPDKW